MKVHGRLLDDRRDKVRSVKNGTPSTHPLTGRELRDLRRHQREGAKSPFVFVSERGAPLSAPDPPIACLPPKPCQTWLGRLR